MFTGKNIGKGLLAAIVVIAMFFMHETCEARTTSRFRISIGGAVAAGAAFFVWSITVVRGAKKEEKKDVRFAADDTGSMPVNGEEKDEDNGFTAHVPVITLRF